MKLTDVSRVIRRLRKVKRCGAVIVAAGTASRMKGIDKIMEPLGGDPVILRTVRAFQESPVISEIVVVTREEQILPISRLCAGLDKVRAVVAGGATRQESVARGLSALAGQVELVAVQDGARPLVSQQLIDRVVRAARTYGAAVPAVPVKDTVKIGKGGLVAATPDRKRLNAIQTPQAFDYDLLRGALEKARKDGAEVTDDSSAVERLGMSVKIVEGEERNLKITTPMDLEIARLYLEGSV